ncbi:extracellular solute-binding protein [Lichenihabitans sp. Uapishka_5]|uniref:extracellular solute-binding protein n=1 Tax=Lichenihabitans sp. Uapishka_5 TaxID=3037302 RepID=UPI0029E7FE7F|nr:extracellular solute-binding protein [Lichenihabitans sp. Uapishka_5]MDX7949669.1 extracellular solute-binding protein [Lichenihabitans sp. Uapishka_5]
MTLRGSVLAGSLALLASTALSPAAFAKDISFIYCGDAINPVHKKAFDAWNSANADAKVAPELVGWEQCQDKATTLAAAGNPVALAYVGSRTLKQFARDELIVPIPMTDAEKASYQPHIIDTITFDGKQWGVPIAFSTKALFWNKDLFKQAGLDPEKPPTTWAEEIADAKAIKEKTGIAGYGLPAKTFDNTMHQFLHYVFTNNGQIEDASGKVVLDSPQNLAALTTIKDLVPYAEEGPTAYEQNEVRAIFLDGKLGMIENSTGAIKRLEGTKLHWGVANLPLGPDAKGPGTLLITDSLAVFKGSGVEPKAIEFAKFLTAPARQEEYELEGDDGLVPLRPSPTVDKFVADHPAWKPFLDGIKFGGPEPLFTDYKGFQNAMIDMVQAVVTVKATPADALKKTAADVEQYK